MARVRTLLREEERYELVKLFFQYPETRLAELIQEEDEDFIPEKLLPYLPYLESEMNVALFKALDNYNKGNERGKKKRPRYFKAFVDKISKTHIDKTVIKMNGAISRIEGTASRKPTKADKKLYEKLQLIKNGENLVEVYLDELLRKKEERKRKREEKKENEE